MRSPPELALRRAIEVADKSPCVKSKRGVSAYVESAIGAEMGQPLQIVATAFNGPPHPFKCDGTDACKKDCGKRCMHAEARVCRQLGIHRQPDRIRLVHIKLVDGLAVAGGGPSCWQCSRDILDAGFGGIWLYQEAHTIQGALVDGDPQWVFYNAVDFHKTTLKECGIHA